MSGKEKIIYTIGHSTRSLNTFIGLLANFQITLIADVRSYPGSKKYPHFNKEYLQEKLASEGINYEHMPELGGRRKPLPNSKNTGWRNDSFRGYADYMESHNFFIAIEKFQKIATEQKVAYMCAEAVWWRCHRSLISDFLKSKGWKVIHIIDIDKSEEHPYTLPAMIINGELSYNDSNIQPELF